ncbi:TetR/AcrR family transcriptional regulator [Kitasatospora sp. NBC_00315]|uniref:TetR/AcrR family transcriptional regulator n=1 Tax=Kitasatospora sp. NBC_00315 TaxID=2975963 RepID=UPI003243D2ED
MSQTVLPQAVGGPAAETVPTGRTLIARPAADMPVGEPVGPVAGPARPVRRRGRELEEAIFEATLDHLTSGGYARLTMEGVATSARTGKAALYRRWASKMELVLDALDATLPPPAEVPDLGSVRSELLLLIDRYLAAMESRAGGAMHALMNELDHGHSAQGQVFRDFVVDRVVIPTKTSTLAVLGRGVERGDVRPGADNAMVADIAPAMLMYRVKMCGGDRLEPGFSAELVDEVLMPMVRR